MGFRDAYGEYLNRAERQHGERFSRAGLAEKFVPYFRTGQRIKVKTSWGDEITGTVGVTTGWQPCFLLMRRRSSIGSSDTLSDRDTIIGVQVGKRYRAI